MAPSTANLAIWTISAIATAAVIARPFRLPEAIWAAGGAILLVATGLLPLTAGLAAVGKGLDVYLFLIGMMLLSEVARREGLFDWVAAYAVNHAKGSPRRLFLLIYAVGVVVTVFLSNDATAVVLTPAVFAAARKAKVDPLPYLFVCAFVANAASFVLPISNPANIVLYGDHTPPLGRWLASFTLPSLLAILATYLVLRWVEARRLDAVCERDIDQPPLSGGGKLALAGIAVTALALVIVSALDKPLGAPTALLGAATTVAILVARKAAPWPVLKSVSWSVLPLVAGLFVLVEALEHTGLIGALAQALKSASESSAPITAAVWGGLLAFASNLMNNLPAGLIASTAISQAQPPRMVIDALLIGVDLGPNLSITGSLATILWLTAIRREGEDVTFWRFLKVGALVMPPALALAVGARLLLGVAG
ncbi:MULTISPECIES: arsenic transporter [Caulobacter]|uniref:Arsenite efflux membrane protein ArsB n=1 Tax=Caulobacter vibrioides OR37 TaxID=1292034 RepID=R0D6F9_CAUVI|nr:MULTISPECIES: arsenic transporter [Caulobacter]ENZ83955.1 arsenite efflux membrane protein ArsB [Caulobacter vibrioides OR37]MBQ1562344.1 arsenic transporter [Caulobacter sp.]